MTPLDLDERYTFDAFIVGPANRLAAAAAKRVAGSPGISYNPLFVYSASGLGKTHLLTATGLEARRLHPTMTIVYDTLDHFMDEVMEAIRAGEREAFRGRFRQAGLLLLDDVQFLAGQHRTQEELLRTWDLLSSRGGQVVLASDRPPTEIDGLDERLLSRFSGGLIVDMAAPDYETRVAIVRRKADARGVVLADGVPEALARIAFSNVRELQGALNRLVAAQELESRTVSRDEVAGLLGAGGGRRQKSEFNTFLEEIRETVSGMVSEGPDSAQLERVAERWEAEGYRARRLAAAAASPAEREVVEALIRGYEADVERLREIASEIDALEPGAAELARLDVLRDPDRLGDAEQALADVRLRNQPLPGPPPDACFDRLDVPQQWLAVRAARAAAAEPGSRYNPLFIHGPAGAGKTALLGALGREIAELHPAVPVAFIAAAAFAAELITAIEHNRLESWRARYRRAGAFLLDDLDALSGTERAQEELFHLFEFLQRADAQLAFTSTGPPGELSGIEARLRTRLESGLVVELRAAELPDQSADVPEREAIPAVGRGSGMEVIGPAAPLGPASALAQVPEGGTAAADDWFLSREKVLWHWPYLHDLLVEELD